MPTIMEWNDNKKETASEKDNDIKKHWISFILLVNLFYAGIYYWEIFGIISLLLVLLVDPDCFRRAN